MNAFPHTQLVTTARNPEIVRELLADDVTKRVSAPVGIRSDCLGVYAPLPVWAEADKSHYVESKDPLVGLLKDRLASALVITEWPDEETAMAMGLLVKMSGNDRIETLRAFNAEEMQRILQKMP